MGPETHIAAHAYTQTERDARMLCVKTYPSSLRAIEKDDMHSVMRRSGDVVNLGAARRLIKRPGGRV